MHLFFVIQNTEESLNYALEVYSDFKNNIKAVSTKGKAFLATHCLKQNKSTPALEIVHSCDKYLIDLGNIQLEAQIQLKNYEFVKGRLESTIARPSIHKLYFIDTVRIWVKRKKFTYFLCCG